MRFPKYMTVETWPTKGGIGIKMTVKWWGWPFFYLKAMKDGGLTWREWPEAALLVVKATISEWIYAIEKKVK